MRTVDLRGVLCPTNFVKAKLVMEMLEDGELVQFQLDGGEPVKNVPRSLVAEGHRLVRLTEVDGYFCVTMEKVE